MNIIEWLNANFDAGDGVVYTLIALLIWFVIWKMLSKYFERRKLYGILGLGAVGSFLVLVFISLIGVLFVASIQATISFGLKMLFPLTLFWGGLIAFFIFLIKKLKK